jgi:two-component system phosphate regulon sensor histidine kinase PhoR
MEPEHTTGSQQEKIDFFLLSAHEIRTSLSAMKWLFKMLHDGDYGALTSEQLSAIDQAARANDNMVTLLNNTMNAIKNEGVVAYEQDPIHLPLFIAEIVKEFTGEATGKHIALTYHQSPVPITVTGDESKLRIAFHNIIENAIKYSRPNTEVIISLMAVDNATILTVQDHGIGVPQDQTSHLFEKFFRAGNSAETGTGLGLYSTKLIIERHGGTIALASEEGKGSTVTVTLPLAH